MNISIPTLTISIPVLEQKFYHPPHEMNIDFCGKLMKLKISDSFELSKNEGGSKFVGKIPINMFHDFATMTYVFHFYANIKQKNKLGMTIKDEIDPISDTIYYTNIFNQTVEINKTIYTQKNKIPIEISYQAICTPIFVEYLCWTPKDPYITINTLTNIYKNLKDKVKEEDKNKCNEEDKNIYINNFRIEEGKLYVFFSRTEPETSPEKNVTKVEIKTVTKTQPPVIKYVYWGGGGCWEDGICINVRGKGWIDTKNIISGDYVQIDNTDNFAKVINVTSELCHINRLVYVNTIGLTQGHPIFTDSWKRADEMPYYRCTDDRVVQVYNLTLESDHSVLLKKGDVYITAATEGRYPTGWRFEHRK
jgi:hypothetical protein